MKVGSEHEHMSQVDIRVLLELQGEDTQWDLAVIAEEMGVTQQVAGRWRTKALRYIRKDAEVPLSSDMLPEPDFPFPRKPLWKAGTIRSWAMRTGRMRWDGTSVPGRAPGRPRHTPVDEPFALGA